MADGKSRKVERRGSRGLSDRNQEIREFAIRHKITIDEALGLFRQFDESGDKPDVEKLLDSQSDSGTAPTFSGRDEED